MMEVRNQWILLNVPKSMGCQNSLKTKHWYNSEIITSIGKIGHHSKLISKDFSFPHATFRSWRMKYLNVLSDPVKLCLQNLMRHENLSEEQKLERIFRNAHSDYQWYIGRNSFKTSSDLIQLADDLESIPNNGKILRIFPTSLKFLNHLQNY